MGVKGLSKIFGEEYIKTLKIKDLRNTTVAIDANNWFYQFLCAGRKGAGGDILNSKGVKITIILGLYRRIVFMLKNKMKLVFVFDGKPPTFKVATLENRKENKIKAQEKIDKNDFADIVEKKKLLQRASCVTKNDIVLCKKLLKIMGIPFINAPGEADAELAYLSKNKMVDYIISEDNDIVVFGGNNVVKGFKASKSIYDVINIDDFYVKTGLVQEDLAKIAIILGCDYFGGVKGIGIKRILKMIENGKIEFNLAEERNPEVVNKILQHFLNPQVSNIKLIEFAKIDFEKLNNFLATILELGGETIQKSLKELKLY